MVASCDGSIFNLSSIAGIIFRFAPDSALEGSGFELPVRGSGEAGLSPLFLAPIAWDGSACCGSALFFIDIDRLTPSL